MPKTKTIEATSSSCNIAIPILNSAARGEPNSSLPLNPQPHSYSGLLKAGLVFFSGTLGFAGILALSGAFEALGSWFSRSSKGHSNHIGSEAIDAKAMMQIDDANHDARALALHANTASTGHDVTGDFHFSTATNTLGASNPKLADFQELVFDSRDHAQDLPQKAKHHSTTVTAIQNHAKQRQRADNLQPELFGDYTWSSGTEIQVNDVEGAGEGRPAITGLPDDRFAVTWGNNTNISAQVFNSDGTQNSTQFRVNAFVSRGQGYPAIISLPGGGFVITWTNSFYAGNPTYAQIFNSDGTQNSTRFQVTASTTPDNRPAISSLPGNRFVVTWAYNNRIYAQIFNGDSTQNSTQFQVNTDANYELSPAVSGLPKGKFAVAWDSYEYSGTSRYHTIRIQFINGDGTKNGTEIPVSDRINDGSFIFPAISRLPNGKLVVAWEYGCKAFAQILNEDGTQNGAQLHLNDDTYCVSSPPAVSSLPDGGFAVTRCGFAASDYNTYRTDVQIYTGDGVSIGPRLQISADNLYSYTYPATSSLADGSLVTAWNRDDNLIHARITRMLSSHDSTSPISLIAGLVVGGMAVTALSIFTYRYCKKHYRDQHNEHHAPSRYVAPKLPAQPSEVEEMKSSPKPNETSYRSDAQPSASTRASSQSRIPSHQPMTGEHFLTEKALPSAPAASVDSMREDAVPFNFFPARHHQIPAPALPAPSAPPREPSRVEPSVVEPGSDASGNGADYVAPARARKLLQNEIKEDEQPGAEKNLVLRK